MTPIEGDAFRDVSATHHPRGRMAMKWSIAALLLVLAFPVLCADEEGAIDLRVRILRTTADVPAGAATGVWWIPEEEELTAVLEALGRGEGEEAETTISSRGRASLSLLVRHTVENDAVLDGRGDPIPQPNTVREGLIAGMDPRVLAEEGMVRVLVTATVARLVRPMPTFVTRGRDGREVTLRLPEVLIDRARTELRLPRGRTALLHAGCLLRADGTKEHLWLVVSAES
jgi:hypothetical protein